MKILIDLTSLYDNFSGIERYALNISKQLINQDYVNEYILIFKNSIHEEFKGIIEKENITVKILKGKNKLIFNQIILPYNLYRIRANKYLFLAFPSPILFFKEGILNTIHDLTCWDYPHTMKLLSKWYFKLSILNAIKISEKIITVSKFSRSRILDKFNLKKDVIVIYNGVSEVFEKFEKNNIVNNLVKTRFNLPNNYIMSLGTLEPRKNLNLLINAYAELKKEKKINTKLVLVGRKGWKFDSVINSIDKDIRKDIIFTGFVEDKYLPYIYYNSDLFILPSLYEGFGIPVIEAISVNIPILLSNIQPFLEVTNNNAEYFKNNNEDDLKIKIIKMLKSEQKKKNILLEDIGIYKWEIQSKKLLEIIEE